MKSSPVRPDHQQKFSVQASAQVYDSVMQLGCEAAGAQVMPITAVEPYHGPYLLATKDNIQVLLPIGHGQDSFGEPGWFVHYRGSQWHGHSIETVERRYRAEGFHVHLNFNQKNANSAPPTPEPPPMRRRIHIPGITNVAPDKPVQAPAQSEPKKPKAGIVGDGSMRSPYRYDPSAPLEIDRAAVERMAAEARASQLLVRREHVHSDDPPRPLLETDGEYDERRAMETFNARIPATYRDMAERMRPRFPGNAFNVPTFPLPALPEPQAVDVTDLLRDAEQPDQLLARLTEDDAANDDNGSISGRVSSENPPVTQAPRDGEVAPDGGVAWSETPFEPAGGFVYRNSRGERIPPPPPPTTVGAASIPAYSSVTSLDTELPINARIAQALGWPSVWQDPRPGVTDRRWFMEQPDPNRPGHNIVEIVPDYITMLREHLEAQGQTSRLMRQLVPAPGQMTREERDWAMAQDYVELDIRSRTCVVIREYAYREHIRQVGQRFQYE